MELGELQRKIRVAKDKRNDFGKYNYRTAEGILAIAKKEAPEDAAIVLSDTLSEVAGQLILTATVTLTIGDRSWEATGQALHGLEKKGMDPAQITGSCSSYARKYALQGLFAIDDGSTDPDSHDNTAQPETNWEAVRDRIKNEIGRAETAEQLKEAWQRNWRDVRPESPMHEAMKMELTKAKDDKKAQLTEQDT